MRLTIRRRATDGVNVMLHINGQFLCNEYSGNTYVTVKFDEGALEKFGVLGTGFMSVRLPAYARTHHVFMTWDIPPEEYRVGKK